MAYYNDTRKARKLLTNLEISHMDYMNKVTKDFENDITPQIIDTRTRYEKIQDKNYVNQQLRKMVYNLFDNDPESSEKFIKEFYLDGMTYTKFSTVYDVLEKQFKGTEAGPFFVFDTAKQLIKNIVETGTTGGYKNNNVIENLQELKEDLKNYNFNNKFTETETVNKLNAMIYLYKNVFDDSSTITFNTMSQLTKQQFKDIRDNLKYVINDIIKYLVRDDINEKVKHENILRLMATVKDESIRQITSLIQNNEITIN